MRETRLLLATLGVLFGLFMVTANLQAQTASVTGTVSDATGAVVPSAKVTARNSETNAARSAETGDTGTYRITNLVPGRYEVVFEKQGFRTLRYSNITLAVDQNLTLDVKIEIGTVTEAIEVSGQGVAPIELDNAQISNVVDQRRITDLPLITRDPYSLVLLSPGTVQTNSSLGGFAVNGSRERNNNFLLDGVDNNDTDVPGIAGGIIGLNPDATQEFRVITNNFLPEFGRNTGGIIDIVSKSGTNELHGVAYWFGRYAALGARDFFNQPPAPKNPYVRNQFGASAGGPIWKDKTFWFLNYEGHRFRTTLVNTSIVPTAAFKTGLFTFRGSTVDIRTPSSPNNRFSLPLDPTIQRILALYPAPNAAAVDDVRGLLNFPSSSQERTDDGTVKIDQHFGQKHVLSGRYIFSRFEDPNPFHSDFLPGGLGSISTFQRTQGLSLNLTSNLRATLINEFRFGGNRTHLEFGCGGASVLDSFGGLDSLGRGRDYGLPSIAAFSCGGLGDSDGQSRFTGTYEWADNLTWLRGRHTVKFGTDIRAVYSNSFNDFSSRALLNFSVFSNFGLSALRGVATANTSLQNMVWSLFGQVAIHSQSQYFNKRGTRTADDLRGFRQREVRFFGQDSWKLKPNFTLNYGLAWQFYGVPFEVNDNFSALLTDPSGSAPFNFTIVGRRSKPHLFGDYYRNWEPRIGFAWDPFKNGKTSIRGAYGIFHDRVFGNLFGNSRGNPPFQQDFQNFPVFNRFGPLSGLPVPPQQTPSTTVADGTGIFPVLFQQNLRTPYSQGWNVGVQRAFWGSMTVEVNYVGTKGTRLLRVMDGNPPQPNLVAQLLAFCTPTNPANTGFRTPTGQCDATTLQFTNLWFGKEIRTLPFDAVNNNAFFQAALNTAQANSTYHALQLNISKRLSHGLQIQGAYTYSHSIDNASDPLVPASGNRTFPRNSFALNRERGNSDFDIRQHLVINFIYEIPLGRGRSHWTEGLLGKLFEGWEASGIATFSDGIPFDIFGNRDSQHTGLSDRASLVGAPTIPAGSDKTQTGPPLSAFGLTAFNQASKLGRNVFVGPGINNWNFAFIKTTTITERWKLDFRTEMFNPFNRVQFTRPGNNIANPGTFGKSSNTVTQPDRTTTSRQIQFGLKLHF